MTWPVFETRFEANTYYDPMSGCWLWGGANRFGYGIITHNGKVLLAHRVSYQRSKGPIPHGMAVCHRCDNPPCINPDHLFLGTHAENMADMKRKGRANRHTHQIGEQCHQAKLTEADVIALRRGDYSGLTYREIGAALGVRSTTIHMVLSGQNWKHVQVTP